MLGIAILAASALTGAPAMPADPQLPIRLQVEREGDFLDIKVVGVTAPAEDARFNLEVASGGAGGNTKTVQAGQNRAGQVGGTLLSSRIRISAMASWSARLQVRIGAREYTMSEPG